MKRFFVVIGGVLLLPCCGTTKQRYSPQQERGGILRTKTNRYIAKKLDAKSLSALDGVRLQEAKMVDIPIPLSAEPLPEYFDPASPTIMLGYEDTTLSPAGIEDFYMKEMERLGWKSKEQFIGYESKLRFTKPERSCFISIRFDTKKQCTCFVIATGAKETLGNEQSFKI